MRMMELKPTHKPVQSYYAALRQFDDLGVSHESAVKSAFHGLLDHCARQHNWTLVPEWEIRRPRQHPLRVDGALLVWRPRNAYTFVASLLGSGEARRGSIPAVGCDREATKSRTQKRRNPPGGMSFRLRLRGSLLTDRCGYARRSRLA
jgi:hypothetical protein